jgi:putative oxidoreductase
MSTVGTVLSIVLGIAFLGAGATKVANAGPQEEEFIRYRLPAPPPQTARVLVGLTELTATVLLAIGAIADSRGVAVVGGIVVIATMLGALATHARIHDPLAKMAPAIILGLAGVALIAFS